MRRRTLMLALLWLVGVAATWVGLWATASRPWRFGPDDWRVVGTFGDEPRVVVARHLNGTYGQPLYGGPVEVWDVDAGRRLAAVPVVPVMCLYHAAAAGRWLLVRPLAEAGTSRTAAVFDLADGREVGRAAPATDWLSVRESGGRPVVMARDRQTDDLSTVALAGGAGWTDPGSPELVTDRHVVCAAANWHPRPQPTRSLTVRRAADGAVLGTVVAEGVPWATDGRRLLTSDGRVWDITTAAPLYQLTGLSTNGVMLIGWFTPDGRWLAVRRDTPAGLTVCWHDAATGAEDPARRLTFAGLPSPQLIPLPGNRVGVFDQLPPQTAGWTNWLRRWVPMMPPPDGSLTTVLHRIDAATGRRLADGHPELVAERPDGRPLLTGPNLTPARAWADRPDWLFAAVAAGWTLALLAAARVRRRPVVR